MSRWLSLIFLGTVITNYAFEPEPTWKTRVADQPATARSGMIIDAAITHLPPLASDIEEFVDLDLSSWKYVDVPSLSVQPRPVKPVLTSEQRYTQALMQYVIL